MYTILLISWLVFIIHTNIETYGLWGDKNENCPFICTCRLEHLTETAIYRFMQKKIQTIPAHHEQSSPSSSSATIEYNDVLYEDNIENGLFEDKPIVRSAICILQTETDPLNLLNLMPSDIESLTIIQGYDTGNKTIKFSYLNIFKNLLSLELLGPNSFNKLTNSHLICEIDNPLSNLKFLNLESVLIKNSKKQIQNFISDLNENELIFEYVQKFDYNLHPLTMVQKGINDDILPYNKYKEQDNTNKIPLFIGFKNLYLLRITHCELNIVHWAMFDGLNNLKYLILDKNNLKFIPPFAFYGTPNIETLSLAHNNLLDIQITDLAGLLELQFLDLSFNNFTQLSELSLPPFPKLKLANFANNPINIIFPNTFEVMNTTDSLIVGGNDISLTLMTNSFVGLNLLKELTINNLHVKLLKRDFFIGMPNLKKLIINGNITEIEFDTFLEISKLKKLLLSQCYLKNLSMDSFIGLDKLELLDLSNNNLEYLPPGIFDQLNNLKELYLNFNKFKQLPRDIFSKLIHIKLIRLNDNPWHCSCEMSEWKPMIINKIKQKIIKNCDLTHDKGISCQNEDRFIYKYIYDNKISPKCSKPKLYLNWSIFHVMRRLLKCPEYKPKLKKHHQKLLHNDDNLIKTINKTQTNIKHDVLHHNKNNNLNNNNSNNNDNNKKMYEDNGVNMLYSFNELLINKQDKIMKHKIRKLRKYKKKMQQQHEENFEQNSLNNQI